MYVSNLTLLIDNYGLRNTFNLKTFARKRLRIKDNGKAFPLLLLEEFLDLLGLLPLVYGNQRNLVLGER